MFTLKDSIIFDAQIFQHDEKTFGLQYHGVS